MFDEFLGLPAHPLIVHAAVVFAPLLAALSIAYALVPRLRPRLDWAVALLAVVTPITVFAAKQSGESFKTRLFQDQTPDPVAAHESFALPLLISAIALGVLSLLLVYAANRSTRQSTIILGALTVVAAAVVGYYVARSGHSGATAVWGG
ncbi:hypothetical protein Aph01nite_12520 [Acrocarpospora phusangensis]|uniref:DUF2231 domain-containing protein n=1 Tax=Acrocarpospora phusangensis TaxID=1070424 RepID=A0A919Q602_9ACTN|nr:DUF2231 domain-containing protein [Acrocarpospora phusangensis]GIH22942.1 hypothetical protein Aph01nite_12520 [Acrocarpospora phusangensis]